MKKGIVIALIGAAALLAGCTEQQQINYEGKLIPETEAEERIADQLEVDNPELDLEVDIYLETED